MTATPKADYATKEAAFEIGRSGSDAGDASRATRFMHLSIPGREAGENALGIRDGQKGN